jgi:putative intracellular protease/amidase
VSTESEIEEGEVVDGLPVLAEQPGAEVVSSDTTLLPAKQVAAMAAGSFAVGAATMALAHRRKVKKIAKRRKKKGGGVIGEVIGSNSFLVDVHLLKRN